MEQADNKNEKETQEDNKNDAELKDGNKDGEKQDINNNGLMQGDKKNHEVMLGDNKNDGLMQEDDKNDGETQESKNGGEKSDDKGVGQQEGFENETQKHEDNKEDANASSKLESSERVTSTLLKPKRKLVKKSQAMKVRTRKKKRQVNAGKDGECSSKNFCAGEESNPKQNCDQQTLEDHQAGDNEKDAKACAKHESSEKGTSTLLKPKWKLLKKSQAMKVKGRKKERQVNGGKDGEGSARNMYAGEESEQKQNCDRQPLVDLQAESNNVKGTRKRIEYEPPLKIMDTADVNKQKKKPRIGKGKDGEEDTQNRSAGGEPCAKKSDSPGLKNKGKAIKLEKGQKKKRIQRKHRKSNDERGMSLTNEMRKEKGKSQTNASRKEKLGGLIFMCNGKTKPDCFRYGVMGVSQSNKRIVMGVRPGTKLFLFDFDLKLLYGVYNASSCGGVKLEPKAFGGAFPFQVRFTIVKECFPLPESVFKKAIVDNYDGKKKFKTELTIRQVRKLRKLFRPVGPLYLEPTHSPPRKTTRDNDLRDSTRGALVNSHRDGRDLYGNTDLKQSYAILSQDRDRRLSYPDATLVHREEIPRDLFLTEKGYRAYGLGDERRNVSPLVQPTLEIYRRDYGRENHLNHLESSYKESVPSRLETRRDVFYLNDKDYRTHGHVSSGEGRGTYVSDYTNNPYYAFGTSSSDPSLHHLRREEVVSRSYRGMVIEADRFGRRETLEDRLFSRDNLGGRENVGESLYLTDALRRGGVRDSSYSTAKLGRSEAIEDRLYSRYAMDALNDRNQTALSRRALHETASLPVSSRYAFDGPSYTHG